MGEHQFLFQLYRARSGNQLRQGLGDAAVEQHAVAHGGTEVAAGRECRIAMDGIIVAGEAGEAVEVSLQQHAAESGRLARLPAHRPPP